MTTEFETTTCSRCGGNGRYSFCLRYGDRCFKCKGAGKCLTPRGKEAYRYYKSLFETTLGSLKTGNRFIDCGVKRRVVSVKHQGDDVIVTTEKMQLHMPKNYVVLQCAPTSEIGRERKEKALRYQAELTKKGALSKRSKAEEFAHLQVAA